MKKSYTIIFILSAILLLTSCSAKNTAEESSSNYKEPIVLKWYTSSDDATNRQRQYPELIANFEKENPGIKIELKALVETYNFNEYEKKLNLMLSMGEQADFIETSTLVAAQARAADNQLAPLDEFAKNAGILLPDEFKGIIPIDGKIYTIPWKATQWMIFINKNMLDAAGLPIPPLDWTWDDYRKYAIALTKMNGSEKIYGSYFHTWGWFDAIGMQSKIIDNPYFKSDLTPNLDNPAFKGSMKYRYDLENVYKCQVPYIDIVNQNIQYRSIFLGGKVAMEPMGAWMVTDILLKEKYPHTFKTTFAAFPRWDNESKANTSTVDGAGSGWGINSKCTHKEEAFKFLTYFLTKGWDSLQITSSYKKNDFKKSIETLSETPDANKLIDFPALEKILLDKNKVENIYTFVGPGENEIITMYTEENKKFLTGAETLDVAINNIIAKSKQLSDAFKSNVK